jgi:hypothetical protein
MKGHGMRIPPAPQMREKQRYSYRFWSNSEMMDLLSIYHGNTKAVYPRTWQYRTLISAHREQYSRISVRLGYGPDWRHEIKEAVIRYSKSGRLPLSALKIASEKMREAEMRIWVESRVIDSKRKKKEV